MKSKLIIQKTTKRYNKISTKIKEYLSFFLLLLLNQNENLYSEVVPESLGFEINLTKSLLLELDLSKSKGPRGPSGREVPCPRDPAPTVGPTLSRFFLVLVVEPTNRESGLWTVRGRAP